MAAKKKYAAPTTGLVRTPKGVAKGVGVQYDPRTGQPTGFVSTSFAPGVSLAPGMGIKYVNGKPVGFQKAPPKGGYRAPAGGGVPSAPGAGAAAGSSVTAEPPDATYLSDYNKATRTRDTLLANLAQQRSASLSDYGFTEGSYDPSSAGYGALAVDPNNPFSRAALLKKTYDQNRRSAGQQMGSQGNLYAGSYQNTQDAINRNQLGDENTLQKSLINFLAKNTLDYGQAGTDFTNTVSAADASRIGRIQDNALYNPAPAAAPAAAAPPGFSSVQGKSKAGVPGTWHVYPDGRKVFVRS